MEGREGLGRREPGGFKLPRNCGEFRFYEFRFYESRGNVAGGFWVQG